MSVLKKSMMPCKHIMRTFHLNRTVRPEKLPEGVTTDMKSEKQVAATQAKEKYSQQRKEPRTVKATQKSVSRRISGENKSKNREARTEPRRGWFGVRREETAHSIDLHHHPGKVYFPSPAAVTHTDRACIAYQARYITCQGELVNRQRSLREGTSSLHHNTTGR